MSDNYITAAILRLPIRSLAKHLEHLYADLLSTVWINGTGLGVHVSMRVAQTAVMVATPVRLSSFAVGQARSGR